MKLKTKNEIKKYIRTHFFKFLRVSPKIEKFSEWLENRSPKLKELKSKRTCQVKITNTDSCKKKSSYRVLGGGLMDKFCVNGSKNYKRAQSNKMKLYINNALRPQLDDVDFVLEIKIYKGWIRNKQRKDRVKTNITKKVIK